MIQFLFVTTLLTIIIDMYEYNSSLNLSLEKLMDNFSIFPLLFLKDGV